MKDNITEYYFSKKALTLGVILILSFALTSSYLSYTTYFETSPCNDKKFAAIIILSLLVLIIAVSIRRFVTVIYSIVKNRPALILTKENLTDYLNRETIKWSDISEIKDEFRITGKYPRNYITVYLRKYDKKIEIADGAINCKKQDLYRTLIKYHQKYK